LFEQEGRTKEKKKIKEGKEGCKEKNEEIEYKGKIETKCVECITEKPM
jgi:hypothetical protein